MASILADEIFQLGPVVLNFSNLLDKFVRKHVNKIVQLVSDTEEHIADVVLPVSDSVRHVLVLSDSFFSEVLNLCEVLEPAFIAFVDKVNLTLVNKTLDAGILLLFFLPKVEMETVLGTLGSLFLRRVRLFAH